MSLTSPTSTQSAVPFVDAGAHLGGFVVGVLLGAVYFADDAPHWPRSRQLAVRAGGVALLVIFCEHSSSRCLSVCLW